MQYTVEARADGAGRVVHLAGRVTDEVFSFLGPATDALARSGVEQAVVMIDDARFRRLLARFHGSVQLVLTGAERNPIRHWRHSLGAFRHAMHAKPLRAVHLHGLMAALTGAHVARAAGVDASLYYSPHGALLLRVPGRFGPLLHRAAHRFSGAARQRAIANLADARALGALGNADVGWVERPLAAEFFEQPRAEERFPLIVTGSARGHPRHADVFAQMAVLLSCEDLGLSFQWIGSADADARLRLAAAGVAVHDVRDDRERAARLAPGWVYLAPDGMRGFPLFLVHAMAVGLPAVAIDTPYHRNVIRHGETGFLCRTQSEMLDAVAALIDAPALRRQVGEAARCEARRRFSEPNFRDALLAAYDLSR